MPSLTTMLPLGLAVAVLGAADPAGPGTGASVLIGRVVPLVRSLGSIPAGMQRMPPVPFPLHTVPGSGAWTAALVGGGYLPGARWTDTGRWSDVLNAVAYIVIAAVVGRFVVARVRDRIREDRT